MELPQSLMPLVIQGFPFVIRTFADHGLVPAVNERRRVSSVRRLVGLLTLDKLVTVTLPYVRGYTTRAPTMQVHLYTRETENERRRQAGAYVDGRSLRRKQREPA
jgi:hypothetical protein